MIIYKKETLKRERVCENVLDFMNIEFIKKNPCSYLLRNNGRDAMMLFVGKAGIKVNGIGNMSCKTIADFKRKFEECFNSLRLI